VAIVGHKVRHDLRSEPRRRRVPRARPIPDGPLLDILRAIIADNRAGGWRRIKADAEANR
jgi:hypothetical protein